MRVLRAAALGLLAAAALLTAVAPVAAATPSPGATATPNPYAGEPWWVPVGLRGTSISAVSVSGADIEVTAGGRDLVSSDGGRTFSAPPADQGALAGPVASADVRSGGDEWLLRGGRVLHASAGGAPAPDPGSPDLGPGAHLLAAPVATPGVVVAVADSGVVWRRLPDGGWNRSLLLLPRSLIGGIPGITDLAGFSTAPPGSQVATIYMATDGYSVLATGDAGRSWIRDGPGLPDRVRALATAPSLQAVFAATDDGLWVHHLRPQPAIPHYAAPDLSVRQRGIAAITLGACGLGAAGLWLALRRRPVG